MFVLALSTLVPRDSLPGLVVGLGGARSRVLICNHHHYLRRCDYAPRARAPAPHALRASRNSNAKRTNANSNAQTNSKSTPLYTNTAWDSDTTNTRPVRLTRGGGGGAYAARARAPAVPVPRTREPDPARDLPPPAGRVSGADQGAL